MVQSGGSGERARFPFVGVCRGGSGFLRGAAAALAVLLLGAGVSAAWEEVGSLPDETFFALHFLDARVGFGGTWGGGLLRTNDGGRTWERVAVDLGLAWVKDIEFWDQKRGLAVTSEGAVLRTEDGGATWVVRSFPGLHFEAVRCVGEARAWVVGGDGVILVTEDGGQEWERQGSPFAGLLLDVDFTDLRRGWIVGERGAVLATVDGGATWERRDAGSEKLLYCVRFVSAERGWIGGRDGTLLRTDDGGRSFHPVAAAGAAEIDRILFVDSRTGWAIGGDPSGEGVILATTDGGASWRRESTPVRRNWWQSIAALEGGPVWIGGNGGVLLRSAGR
jgi:photosystem II stability/assembly factor-like uncharacterized protein